ncbi:MAG TPA: TIGR03620 family F420-dependent LLM class oxidoreductase [Candidatus Limnocylindria bacterium]|nr:TIGR03620 family F420-dependent LLM class oxidoreductase [Candidatus Limnocylindria bacterium]
MTREDVLRWRERLGPVGAWSFDAERLSADDARAYARELESLGVPALWLPESLGSKEIFAHSSIVLAATERLVIATGIANIWARDPVAMANGQRAITDAYPGRFLLGLGVSHAPVLKMRGQNATYERPLEHMREYLDAMDMAPYTGKPVETARVLAALGPKMLRLAAERTLGAHPYFVPVEHTTLARKELGPDALLAVEQAVVLATDPAVARSAARRHMKRYLALDNYANNLRRLGWTDADIASGGSDALVDAIVAWGDASAIRRRVDEHRARGADHVCIQVVRTDLAAPAALEWRTLAPALITRR